jgi:sugar lactone lactonase YvrE
MFLHFQLGKLQTQYVYIICIVLTDNGEVSFIIPIEGTKDKFVITVGRNVAILTWDGESSSPAVVKYVGAVDNEKEVQSNRLNDGKADPTGRLWAGRI